MKIVTYTSYKEHLELYTKMHYPTTVNSFHNWLARKDIILLLDAGGMLYKAVSRSSVKDRYHQVV